MVGGMQFDLSGIAIRLRDMDPLLAGRFEREWHGFQADARDPVDLDVRVGLGDRDAPEGPLQVAGMTAEFGDAAVRFAAPEGAIEVHESGAAHALLARADGDRRFYALVNLLCAALAWRLPSRGAAILHAAAVVVEGRAFALVGASGSGKSTWANLARSAGAVLLSDELVFADTGGPGVALLGSPIRADHPEPAGPGRWPLAAWLLPDHGRPPRLAPASALAITARLAANLPFVAERIERDPRIGALVAALAARAPAYRLTFAQDASFMDCLRGLGDVGRP